jgi:hypothetical protein
MTDSRSVRGIRAIDGDEEPSRDRTDDLRVKNPLLHQLSYRPKMTIPRESESNRRRSLGFNQALAPLSYHG